MRRCQEQRLEIAMQAASLIMNRILLHASSSSFLLKFYHMILLSLFASLFSFGADVNCLLNVRQGYITFLLSVRDNITTVHRAIASNAKARRASPTE